jgi:Zn-dependent metalloprotease
VIWYRTLTSKAITPTMTFQTFAGLTLEIARRDNADDPSVAGAVEAAWRSVGVVPLAPKW